MDKTVESKQKMTLEQVNDVNAFEKGVNFLLGRNIDDLVRVKILCSMKDIVPREGEHRSPRGMTVYALRHTCLPHTAYSGNKISGKMMKLEKAGFIQKSEEHEPVKGDMNRYFLTEKGHSFVNDLYGVFK